MAGILSRSGPKDFSGLHWLPPLEGGKRAFSRHWGLFVRCFVSCSLATRRRDERKQRERVNSRAVFIGSNEPHRVIPQHGCMPAVPLLFHPVPLFRSAERSISAA